jgi:hypothetical protein
MAVYGGPDIVTSGLVLHLDAGNTKSYPGTGNTWYDLSGNNKNATIYNAVWSSNSRGIFTMNNTQYITIPNTDYRFGTYTITIASRYSGNNKQRILTSLNNNFLLGNWNNGVSRFYAEGWVSYVNSYTFSNDTGWYIYTGTINTTSDQYSFYSNTNAIAINSNAGSQGPNNLAINTGYLQNTGERSDCEVGFLMAYNSILTTAQIMQNYNALKGRFNL